MNKFTSAALLVGGVILASQPALAQFVQNDLYMGFQNSENANSPGDYIINLGPASSITGTTSVLDLSSDFSLTDFNSVLAGSTSMVGAGVVSASNQTGNWDTFATQERIGGAGNPAVPGSSLASLGDYGYAQDSGAVTPLSGLNGPAAGTGIVDSGKTWQSSVESTPLNTQLSGTFWSASGVQPDSTIGDGSVLYEDLWETSTTSAIVKNPWVYVGYFTLDLSGATPKLTFTPTNAPPSLTAPIIVSVKKTGNTVTVVSTNAVPTYTYQLQYTASFSPTNWVNVGSSQVAGGTMVTNSDTSATAVDRFYRVTAQ